MDIMYYQNKKKEYAKGTMIFSKDAVSVIGKKAKLLIGFRKNEVADSCPKKSNNFRFMRMSHPRDPPIQDVKIKSPKKEKKKPVIIVEEETVKKSKTKNFEETSLVLDEFSELNEQESQLKKLKC